MIKWFTKFNLKLEAASSFELPPEPKPEKTKKETKQDQEGGEQGGKKQSKKASKKKRKKMKKKNAQAANDKHYDYIRLDKVPFVLELLLFVSLTKCRVFSGVMCAADRGRSSFMRFMSHWFRGFRIHFKKFIKSDMDIMMMDNKQVRALRKEIALDKHEKDGNIFDLCWNGKNDAVISKLNDGKDINDRNELKRHTSLLHIVSEKNNLDLLKRLMNYKPDINIRDRLLRTPLFYAAEKSNVEICRYLLENGADPNAMDRNNSPLLYWAINFSSLEILKLLFDFGADPDIFCGEGRRPIFKAAYLDRDDVLEWLLSIPRVKLDLNLQDHKGRTGLHAACIGIGAGSKGKVFTTGIARLLTREQKAVN